MTGDNNGRWAGNFSWPDDHSLYTSAAEDVIRMLRRHPSLLFWCGGNELYPTTKNPAPDISRALVSLVRSLDPGRPYVSSSMSNQTGFDPEYALAPKDGPYLIMHPVRHAL